MTVKERIKSVIIHYNTNVNKLANGNSALQRKLQRQINESSKVSAETLDFILAQFPDLSEDWLLTGEGDMLKDDGTAIKEESVETYEEIYPANVIPLLPVEAIAGGLQYWSSRVELADCRKVVSPIPGADYAIQVSGDSMEPEIHNGTYVYIKKINERSFIPWGNTMVVDTENGVVVKKLFPIENDSNTILAKSVNPAYPPFKIPTESIFGIYRVLGGSFVVSTL